MSDSGSWIDNVFGMRSLLSLKLIDYDLYLLTAINEIDSKEIKKLAKASSWLGNDETHTFKKWEDYDIENLKNFINSIVGYISFKIQTKKAQSLLDSK